MERTDLRLLLAAPHFVYCGAPTPFGRFGGWPRRQSRSGCLAAHRYSLHKPLPPEIWAATPCAAKALIVALQERVRELEARLGQPAGNRLHPPSCDPPQAPARPKAPPTGRKRGGQVGDRGASRTLLRVLAERSPQPSTMILDSRTVQSTPESGARAGYDGATRRKGS